MTGIILTALGGAIAGSLWASAAGCVPGDGGVGCVIANLVVWPIVGSTLFFTGIGYLGYYNTHQITRVDVDANPPDSDAPGVSLSSVGFQPLRNGGVAGVAFSF